MKKRITKITSPSGKVSYRCEKKCFGLFWVLMEYSEWSDYTNDYQYYDAKFETFEEAKKFLDNPNDKNKLLTKEVIYQN